MDRFQLQELFQSAKLLAALVCFLGNLIKRFLHPMRCSVETISISPCTSA